MADRDVSQVPSVTVIGVGADGRLAHGGESALAEAEVLLGARRHLQLVPQGPADRRLLPSPLREGLPKLLVQLAGRRVAVLASGDPMVSGIGTTLVDLLGAARVRVLPAVSSVALARARMGWSAEGSGVLTLVGRREARLVRELAPGRRLLVLTSGPATPATVAALLTDQGLTHTPVTLLADLGTGTESVVTRSAADWARVAAEEVPALHILALEVPSDAHVAGSAWTAGLPDTAYESDGQLTRRDLRASALARLSPYPGHHLWDVGAGAGSVGIEWMRAHPACRTTAVEASPERAARIERNAARLGVPDLDVVTGRAPAALEGLAPPDAVFVGGGATRPGVLRKCMSALAPGGRLVVHGVTLETEHLLGTAHREHGGELTRIQVEIAAPVGTFTGWTPTRTVTQWSWTA